MFRYLILALLLYVAYRFVKRTITAQNRSNEVRGAQKKDPLDIDDAEITDARYEDIDNGPAR